ncbi:unnamed protein product [Thlaspi arvense]|uniref:Protein kinase domain-containing protein n=1 Tax=Thlaspi arvense TaxID=13288 RepID=A0AAU9S6K6_THLAR|nr:unnamed protein product [Thlaspi arvense]
MEMKNIACGVLFAAASMTTVMAAEVGAPAPGPASSGASLAVPALGSLSKIVEMVWWRRKNREVNELQRNFMKNGRLLLEELIAISDDAKSNPIKNFSADEIVEATNNFSSSNLVRIDRFRHYRGMLDNRVVLIKKWAYGGSIYSEKIYRNLAVSSMVSGHKNFLKLLGCCLEFPYPVLVCEYAEVITRSLRGARCPIDPTLTWSMRIVIAKEIANALTYLHSAFSRTLVHKDIQPCQIFLNENGTAKLDYLEEDPERLSKFVKDGRLDKVVDKKMLVVEGRDIDQEKLQVEAFLELSMRCIGRKGDVPKMIEVAKELKRIRR